MKTEPEIFSDFVSIHISLRNSQYTLTHNFDQLSISYPLHTFNRSICHKLIYSNFHVANFNIHITQSNYGDARRELWIRNSYIHLTWIHFIDIFVRHIQFSTTIAKSFETHSNETPDAFPCIGMLKTMNLLEFVRICNYTQTQHF